MFGIKPPIQKEEDAQIEEPVDIMSDDSEPGASQSRKVAMPRKPVTYVPWVEKYRPERIQDVSHQTEAVNALREAIKTGQVPHLLFYGPPGTGKTSTILALAKEMFGKEFYKSRVLELNASDERGISVVRDKIKKFAQRKI